MFTPPEILLDLITFEGRRWVVIILPTFEFEGDNLYILGMVRGALEETYRYRIEGIHHFQHRILATLIEAVKNAALHGNQCDKDKQVTVGCWFGEKGVLLAVRDEGSFFRDSTTKRLVESRVALPSTSNVPGGDGMSTIYESTDHIYVSTEENTLYLVLFI